MVFFILFKTFGIYYATAGFLVASVMQMIYQWLRYHTFEVMHILTFVLGVIFGGATLIFHNEMFIKWKPTIIYWCFAGVLAFSELFHDKNFLCRLMENQIKLAKDIWTKVNFMWIIFFLGMGAVNILVAYHYDTNVWVNFKLFGLMGLTMIFLILQGFYLKNKVVLE